ncbi:MAG: iron-containing alcohol dehydrogenase [Lentisphaerota bacterium]
MLNFEYQNPVRIVFGKGAIAELNRLVPADVSVLMLYGGGSIRKNGVYNQVTAALGKRRVLEFSGIEPNPLYETCMKAVEIIKQENICFLLAVGGGSVLDATKFIAAAALYAGTDPWDILAKGAEVKAAVPLGAVLTLPATGSEMNTNSVISRASSGEKLFFSSPCVYPQFSILDPETTFTLPERQTVNGIVDAYVHVFEQYMTFDVNAPLQDRQAEAILLTLIEEGPKVIENPMDYDARANVMWAATNALNGFIACGVPQDWATHMIGHELTAFYGIDHAQSLAVVLPRLLAHCKETKKAKLLQYGQRIFGLKDADAAIKATEAFFNSLGMKTRLSDYKIDAIDAAGKISSRFKARGTMLGERADLAPDDVSQILLGCA